MASERADALSAAGPYRVLLVDDEPAQRRLQRAVLCAPKYAVSEAGDGAEALRLLAGAAFDLVLLDKRMPGMDGHAVLHQIRAVRGERLLPVILVTAPATSSASPATRPSWWRGSTRPSRASA